MEPMRATWMIAAMETMMPESTYTIAVTFSTLMPERRAVRSLEPMAYTWRPKVVFLEMMCSSTASTSQ